MYVCMYVCMYRCLFKRTKMVASSPGSASETAEEREARLHHGGELVEGGVACIGDTPLPMSWATRRANAREK